MMKGLFFFIARISARFGCKLYQSNDNGKTHCGFFLTIAVFLCRRLMYNNQLIKQLDTTFVSKSFLRHRQQRSYCNSMVTAHYCFRLKFYTDLDNLTALIRRSKK